MFPRNANYEIRYNKANNTSDDSVIRSRAHDEGEQLLNSWLQRRSKEIESILGRFDGDGFPNEPPTATTFSDLYKWTMMPVIRKLEGIKGNIIVTFGIDLRDEAMKRALLSDSDLRDRVQGALNSLRERSFDRSIFERVNAIKNGILSDSDINEICVDGRNLVDGPEVQYFEVNTTEELEQRPEFIASKSGDNMVRVLFYKNKGLHFIEATGPWHRVTWLETSIMQCVYEAKLRYDLEKKGKTYMQWLYGSLLRCAKSVAYTQIVRNEVFDIKPALFTGRRTGGLLFLLLQNMFFAEHIPDALGTSSVDCWHILKGLRYPCVNPSGTHAHELSMVNSVLFPRIDQNEYHLPLTQVVSHYLYYECVWKKTGGPMPMLPDTLGTPAFLKAATYLTIKGGGSFLDAINFARQDSGKLPDFLANIKDYGKGDIGTMASEIDTSNTLLEAAHLKYTTFGAGGFFGDSEKVWGKPDTPSNSMAVKAVRVIRNNTEGINDGEIAYMKTDGDNIIGYPVKIGDPEDRTKPELKAGKLSLDKNLDDATYAAIKIYAETVRKSAAPPSGPIGETVSIYEVVPELANMSNMSGGKRRKTNKRLRNLKRKTRNRR